MEDGVAIAVADGDPEPREDGRAFRVAERADAEQVVLEGWHDVAETGKSRWKHWEVREAVAAECWHWPVAVPMAMGGPMRSMLTMGAVGIK